MSDDLQIRITAQIEDLLAGLNTAADATTQATDRMSAGFDGVGQTLNDLSKAMSTAFQAVGLAAAYEGMKKLSEAIDSIALSAVQMRNTATILGVSATEMAGLRAAAEEAGVGTQALDMGLELLSLRMQQARDGSGQMQDKLATVGITLDNLRDPSFTAASAAVAIANSHATAAEKMDVLGRRGLLLLPVLSNLVGGEQGAIDKARELGALTEDQIEVLGRYHAQISEAAQRWDYFKAGILANIAPLGDLLLRLEDVFGVLNTGSGTTQQFHDVMISVEAEVLKWAAAFNQLYLDTKHVFDQIGTSLAGIAAATSAAAQLQFSQAKEIWNENTQDLLAIDQKYAADTIANANKLQDELNQIRLKSTKGIKIENPAPAPQNDVMPAGRFDNAIKESDRWAQMEIADASKVLDAMKSAAESEAQAHEETKLGEIEVSEKALQEEFKTGQISASQFLAQEKSLIGQKLAAELDYYQKKKALAAGDEAALAKIDTEIAKAHAKALLEQEQVEVQAAQRIDKTWQTVSAHMASTFATAVNGMIFHGETLRTALTNTFTSIGESFVENQLKIIAASGEAGLKEITNAALRAAANAYNAVVGVPYVGPILAPIAAGVAFTAVEAYGNQLATAAGGYDVPATVNPITQLHAREMVLPASLADTVRRMSTTSTAGGSRSSGPGFAGAAGGDTHVHLTVQALDAASFQDYLNNNRDTLGDTINTLIRERGGSSVF